MSYPLNTITKKQILKQLKADLIGKDSYRGVTLTYSWLANQFGHISLGFIPTLLVHHFLLKYTHIQHPAFVAAICIASAWFLFELYNFLGPLLLNKHSTSSKMFIPSPSKYTFQPAWKNVAFDTFTDVCFFVVGAFTASLFAVIYVKAIYIICIFIIILIYPVCYWFVTKMLLQYAKFSVQFRLSQWQGNLTNQDKQTVLQYSKSNMGSGKHLLVFGGRRTGKSLLSVGIATELAINRFACSYYTSTKWYNLLSLNNEEIIAAENCDVWSWRTANLLIIDDINPGEPVQNNFVSPAQIISLIENEIFAQQNKDDLKNKNVIWVMGSEETTNGKLSDWIDMIQKIGVDKNNISAINLGVALK